METYIESKLDWRNFDWQDFQTLSIDIAKNLVPDCNFLEHLKQGQNQDGIDILGFKRKEGKFVAIQCKKQNKLFENDLINIIAEFRKGQYFQNSSHFILITSADLQTRKLQSKINSIKLEFKNENNIDFDCLDRSNIETMLKRDQEIVGYYFGHEQAASFCYPFFKYKNFQKLNAVNDFIPRKIFKFGDSDKLSNQLFSFSQRKAFDLKDAILTNRRKTYRICLIADSYQGKSSFLKQTAFELNDVQNIYPILIEIKNYNVQSIEKLLSTKYGAWKKIPYKNLVLIIDGIDEAPEEKFIEVVNHINEFSISFNQITIIFSCRKLFFTKYDVKSKIEDFETLELAPLDSISVNWYLDRKLNSRANALKEAAYNSGIGSLLYHPFYLVHIVEEFRSPPYKMPDNRISVIDRLIERSYKDTLSRRLKGSHFVEDEIFQFKKTIQKFAFSLQLIGKNSLNNIEIQQILSSDERLLLQHNSLVNHISGNWSFTNALFQEHIAASLLSKMTFQNIISICTVGKSIKKIKTKWIQTLSSLLSILELNSDLYKNLFDLLESDNLELIFQTESSKFEDSFKFILLKKLIDKSIKLNVRTLIVSEQAIGLFIYSSLTCSNYLLDCLENKKLTDRVKLLCLRILTTSQLSEVLKERYIKFVKKSLNHINDTYFAGNIVSVLSSHKIGDKKLVKYLISIVSLNNEHEYRSYVYDLIKCIGLVDQFYIYGLKGLPYLQTYNKGIRHSGSEHNLEDFILATNDISNLSLLLREFKSEGWIEYCERQGKYRRDFLQEIFEKLANLYTSHPLIIFPIAAFIKALAKKYLRQEFSQVDFFLEKTNSHWIVVRILIEDILSNDGWQLGALITHESYDFILDTFEQGDYDLQKLKNCFPGLRYKHKTETANTFYQLCKDATEGEIYANNNNSAALEYQEAEKIRRINDLCYIQSVESFKKGIQKYFDAYGKKTIPEDDLYVNFDESIGLIRQQADSHFIFKYLTNWHRNSKVVSLDQCIKELNKNANFEIFRTEEILEYSFKDEASDKVLIPLIEKYYQDNLATANFTNCLWIDEENVYHRKNKESRLGKIFKNYKFKTDEKYLLEFIWLDDGGIRSVGTASINNTVSLSELVLEKLNEDGKSKLRKKIVDNIRNGIELESVLGTHIGLCKYLKITEAKELILKSVKSASNYYTLQIDGIDIYMELGGDTKEVLNLYRSLTDFNSYLFYHLTVKLSKIFPEEISLIGIKALKSNETDQKRKIELAQVLAEIEVLEAFQFLVNEVKIQKKSPHNIQGAHPITKLNTELALIELDDVMYLVVDPEYNNSVAFHDSAKSIILEWCYTLASKSEEDMELVINFLVKHRQLFAKKYFDAFDINWYINRILENFRTSDETVKSITEIKKILISLDI